MTCQRVVGPTSALTAYQVSRGATALRGSGCLLQCWLLVASPTLGLTVDLLGLGLRLPRTGRDPNSHLMAPCVTGLAG